METTSSGQNNPEVFKNLYCRAFGCDPERFTRTILAKCFFPHALPFGLLMYGLNAPSIDQAIRAINRFARARTPREVNALVDEYYRYIEESGGFWIRFFKVRLSGKRLIRLYNRTLEKSVSKD